MFPGLYLCPPGARLETVLGDNNAGLNCNRHQRQPSLLTDSSKKLGENRTWILMWDSEFHSLKWKVLTEALWHSYSHTFSLEQSICHRHVGNSWMRAKMYFTWGLCDKSPRRLCLMLFPAREFPATWQHRCPQQHIKVSWLLSEIPRTGDVWLGSCGTTPSSSIHVSWNYWTHNVIRNIRTHLQGCRQSRTLVFRNTGAYSNSKGLWSHSKTNSWDLFPEPVNSPQAVPFMKGGRGGFQSFWAFSRSFAALSHLPPSHEGSLLTLERNVSSASCHTAPYPLSFIATEPSATLQQNLPRRNRQETEPPLSRGPNLCCTDGEGKPSKILNERVWNMDIIGTKCLTVMVS